MTQKLNIIIANDYAHITGGADKVAIISAISLAEKNYDVYFFSSVGPVSEELKCSNVNVICLNQNDILSNKNRFQAAIYGIWNIRARLKFKLLLKKLNNKFTIIHLHSFTKGLSTSIIREAINENFKLVLTLHDYFAVCPNGGFFNYNTNEICHLKPMSRKCILCNCDSRKYVHKIWRVLRQNKQTKRGLLPSGIDNYIYISEMSKNVLVSFLPPNAKLYYVKNPVDIEKGKSVNVIKNNSFVYVGRLSKEKGCLLFAEAAKELNVNAVFVGDGELRDEIKRIYPESRITGWVDKMQVVNELDSTRALVFPSLLYETLGLTALEAQARGIPVIVSDACAVREVVKNRRTGLWFKRGDLEDLEEKMKLLMNDKLAKIYGQNAYLDYWENDFSIESHINQLEKVYDDISKRGEK
ncbi:glycosyltransferase family 4 protein [Clostridium sp. MT-14]|uniref:glycosyltransferase family 4 protein n=1 Tax=Clostridium sp. MT-14 TaxID=3348360 RepID=UPI0035F2ADC3